jgi:hypothetical protein
MLLAYTVALGLHDVAVETLRKNVNNTAQSKMTHRRSAEKMLPVSTR